MAQESSRRLSIATFVEVHTIESRKNIQFFILIHIKSIFHMRCGKIFNCMCVRKKWKEQRMEWVSVGLKWIAHFQPSLSIHTIWLPLFSSSTFRSSLLRHHWMCVATHPIVLPSNMHPENMQIFIFHFSFFSSRSNWKENCKRKNKRIIHSHRWREKIAKVKPWFAYLFFLFCSSSVHLPYIYTITQFFVLCIPLLF